MRSWAIEWLRFAGNADAVDPLLERLDDRLPNIRAEAASALAAIGDPRSLPKLREVLLNDSDPLNNTGARQAIIYAIGEIGGTDDVATLLDAFPSSNRSNRLSIIKVLGDIADKAPDFHTAHPEVTDLLLGELGQGSDYHVIEALRRVADPRAADTLFDALRSDNGSTRQSAAIGLGKINDPEVDARARDTLGLDDDVERKKLYDALITAAILDELQGADYAGKVTARRMVATRKL